MRSGGVLCPERAALITGRGAVPGHGRPKAGPEDRAAPLRRHLSDAATATRPHNGRSAAGCRGLAAAPKAGPLRCKLRTGEGISRRSPDTVCSNRRAA